MLCVDSSRLCMSCLSLCDLCLCYSILGSQFSNKYVLTYLLTSFFATCDERCAIVLSRCIYRVSNCCLSVDLNIAGLWQVLEIRLGDLAKSCKSPGIFLSKGVGTLYGGSRDDDNNDDDDDDLDYAWCQIRRRRGRNRWRWSRHLMQRWRCTTADLDLTSNVSVEMVRERWSFIGDERSVDLK